MFRGLQADARSYMLASLRDSMCEIGILALGFDRTWAFECSCVVSMLRDWLRDAEIFALGIEV